MTQPFARRWLGLIFISIGVSLIIVDSTIVNVSVPAIITDLGISSTQVQWVQESYTIVFASLLLLFGSLADQLGRKRLLITGIAIFAFSSVAAAVASSGSLLIVGRFAQGVGGAMILPSTLSLLNATFAGRERGIAFAIWGSTIGGMAAVGPLIGGWLTTELSWRWAFGINIPLGFIVAIGVLATVKESREKSDRGFDAHGALLSVVVFGALAFALIEGRTYGWFMTHEKLKLGAWQWPFSVSFIPIVFAISAVAFSASSLGSATAAETAVPDS